MFQEVKLPAQDLNQSLPDAVHLWAYRREGEWVQDLKVMQTFPFQRKPGLRNVEERAQVTLSAGGGTGVHSSSLCAVASALFKSCAVQ